MRRLGGTTAIALGVVYLLVGVVFFLLPESQRATGPSTLLASLAAEGTAVYLGWQWLFALSGALGLAVVAGLASVFGPDRAGGVRWASAIGYLGFAVTIVDALSLIAFVYQDGHRFFAGADEELQTVIAGDLLARSVAPQGWATFGLVGVWLVAISILALADRALPSAAGVIGVVVGVGYWLVPLANNTAISFAVPAALAIVVAPVFYVWAGLVLRGDVPAAAGEVDA